MYNCDEAEYASNWDPVTLINDELEVLKKQQGKKSAKSEKETKKNMSIAGKT
jgi:hypothetical protein